MTNDRPVAPSASGRRATVTRVIVALDVGDAAAARDMVHRLGEGCDFYKVGLELFSAEGPDIVRWLRDAGKEVFVDLKLHDIPHTVRRASRRVAGLGASLLTVHAVGGRETQAGRRRSWGHGHVGVLL